jgi:hypothetical protein
MKAKVPDSSKFNIDINYQILLDSKHELALPVFSSRERFLKGVLILIFLTPNEYSIAWCRLF